MWRRSRYLAARLANAEQLKLYFSVGGYVSSNTRQGKWGTGAIEAISRSLQTELPGLRGFSPANIKNMRIFFEAWSPFAIRQLATDELPSKVNRQILTDDLTECFILDENRSSATNDFNQKKLRLFYLHVKLRGYRVSVDLTVPEDTTFEQLHTVLNSVFQRDDDHLYRFECDDGCTAVREEEDLEESGAVLSDKCYLGHHLEIGSKVFYLFDYGDEWEHDITVKKMVNVEPKDCHIEVLKIIGEIPEQYPDCDEEDE